MLQVIRKDPTNAAVIATEEEKVLKFERKAEVRHQPISSTMSIRYMYAEPSQVGVMY
jgi:hypothetical protein